MLNFERYMFGMVIGKFIGFMVSQRGIKASPEIIKVIMQTKLLSSMKATQRLTGRIVTLSRFMSRATDRCLPFFRLLRKINNFKWIEECQ